MHREELCDVALSAVKLSQENPRIFVENDAFRELVDSVKRVGVKTRILCQPAKGNGSFVLLAGERRFRAATKAGLTTIPAIVHHGLTDVEAFELTFHENFGREDLTALEQGRAVEIMLKRFSGDSKAVASKLGCSERVVRMRAKLRQLHDDWKEAAADPADNVSRLSVAHLELIARLPDQMQVELLQRDEMSDNWRTILVSDKGRVIAVSKLEKWIEDQCRVLTSALWKISDCDGCRKRTDAQGHLDLWPESAKKAVRCLDAVCWAGKKKSALKARKAELLAKHSNLRFVAVPWRGRGEEVDLKLFPNTLWEYQYDAAKKTDKDAVPALIVVGDGAGRVKWIRRRRYASGSGSSSTRKPGKLSLKERRRVHESKRWARVIPQLRKKVEALPISAVQAGRQAVVSLAAIFGTADSRTSHRETAWPHFAKSERGTKDLPLLWKQVRAVLGRRLGHSYGVTQIPDCLIQEAKHVSAALGIDLAALKKTADQELPEPRAWQYLNADGSPKKAKKKAAKKKGKPSAKKKAGTKRRK